MKTKGKRFCFMQEPNEDDKINVGLMKEMTGNDEIQARGLYQEPVKFKPQFKIVLMCNKLPKIPSDDDGTWRRLKVVEFISKFKDNPDPTEKYEYPIDRQLSDHFDKWRSVFMWRLINKYTDYDKPKNKGGGNKPPKEVAKYTESYKSREDILSKFLVANVLVDMNTEPTTVSKIHKRFGEWFTEEGFDKKDKPSGGSTSLKDKLEKETKYKNARVGSSNRYYIRFNIEDQEALVQSTLMQTFSTEL